MGKKEGSTAFTNLLKQSAVEKEKMVQNISSVVNIEESPLQEPQEEKEETVILEDTEKVTIEKLPESEAADSPKDKSKVNQENDDSKNKKLSDYLMDQKLKNTETVRISKDMHGKLKKLSMASGCGMHVIITNILEVFCESHEKEIQALLKKYLMS